MIYEFTLILADIPELTDEVANRLWEAGCDDTSPGSSCGRSFVTFHREADSLESAIRSAIGSVRQAGFRVEKVEIETETIEPELSHK